MYGYGRDASPRPFLRNIFCFSNVIYVKHLEEDETIGHIS